jgi:type II secretory pathway pseudopilin PulG
MRINNTRVTRRALWRRSNQLSAQREKSAAAYSLVETLIASGIVGIVALATFAGIFNGMAVIQIAREEVRATQLLQEKMETLRLYSWGQLNTPGFVPTTFQAKANPTNANEGAFYSGTVTITNSPLTEVYSTNVLQVTVGLSWTNNLVPRTRSMTTLVSRYGIQNYIY